MSDLRDALKALIADIEDYERVNNLSPSPGKPDCWQSVTRAKAALAQPEAVEPVAYLHEHETFGKELRFVKLSDADRKIGWKETALAPLAPDGERMRRALETIVFHCTISTDGNEIPTRTIQEVALEALSLADEGKESEGGDKPLQDGEVGGSEQPFSAGARQGRKIPQSSKPKAECAGSISAAPLPSDPTPPDATAQREVVARIVRKACGSTFLNGYTDESIQRATEDILALQTRAGG